MTDPLGLSVGAVNLVAARAGQPPISRQTVLTLFDGRPPEVGAVERDPATTAPGLMIRGFVERVGDPAPLVAADGSSHRREYLLGTALDALSRLAGGGSPVSIAVPAHWGAGQAAVLRDAVADQPGLTPTGRPPRLVPDAAAAIAALRAGPGLPNRGVVVLCDIGGSGTSITFVDAATDAPIGPTVRDRGLAGERIDQAILNLVLARVPDTAVADGTAAVGSLARLRDRCRLAKEELSRRPDTVVDVDLAGFAGTVGLSRAELEEIVSAPLDAVLDRVATSLTRSGAVGAGRAAIAIVGGGAAMPVIGARLAQRLRAPIVSVPLPGCAAATGAALLAGSASSAGAESRVGDAPTGVAATAWAAGVQAAAAGESASDGDQSATFRALAWSQDDSNAPEPIPYSGSDYLFDPGSTEPAAPGAEPPDEAGYRVEPAPLTWYRRPVVLFGLAAALLLAATGGLAYTLTSQGGSTGGTTGTPTPGSPPAENAPQPGQPPSTVVVTDPEGRTSVSTVSTAPPADSTTSAEPPATTTSTTPATTTSTTATTASTTPATTEPTTTATSAAPPSTTAAQSSTAPAPSTPEATGESGHG